VRLPTNERPAPIEGCWAFVVDERVPGGGSPNALPGDSPHRGIEP
jgi:hypothetical protein